MARLERGVGERLDLAAVVADDVVVVVAVGQRGLEAGDPVAHVDPLHEPELGEHVEHAVDRGDPDRATLPRRVSWISCALAQQSWPAIRSSTAARAPPARKPASRRATSVCSRQLWTAAIEKMIPILIAVLTCGP